MLRADYILTTFRLRFIGDLFCRDNGENLAESILGSAVDRLCPCAFDGSGLAL